MMANPDLAMNRVDLIVQLDRLNTIHAQVGAWRQGANEWLNHPEGEPEYVERVLASLAALKLETDNIRPSPSNSTRAQAWVDTILNTKAATIRALDSLVELLQKV